MTKNCIQIYKCFFLLQLCVYRCISFLNVFRVMAMGFVVIWLVVLPYFVFASSDAEQSSDSMLASLSEFWLFRLLLNLCGYATIFVPGYLLIRYVKNTQYLERSSKLNNLLRKASNIPYRKFLVSVADPNSPISRFLRLFIHGNDRESSLEEGPASDPAPPEPTFMEQTLKLLWCAGGLLSFYLVWGLVQERIMAFKYGATDTEPGRRLIFNQILSCDVTMKVSCCVCDRRALHRLTVPRLRQPHPRLPRRLHLHAAASATAAPRAALQVLVQLLLQHHVQLVPVRVAQVRQLPHASKCSFVKCSHVLHFSCLFSSLVPNTRLLVQLISSRSSCSSLRDRYQVNYFCNNDYDVAYL